MSETSREPVTTVNIDEAVRREDNAALRMACEAIRWREQFPNPLTQDVLELHRPLLVAIDEFCAACNARFAIESEPVLP